MDSSDEKKYMIYMPSKSPTCYISYLYNIVIFFNRFSSFHVFVVAAVAVAVADISPIFAFLYQQKFFECYNTAEHHQQLQRSHRLVLRKEDFSNHNY